MIEENFPEDVIFKLCPKGKEGTNSVKNQRKNFTGRGIAKALIQERGCFVPKTARPEGLVLKT